MMDRDDDGRRAARRAWFGPKRLGWGLRPQTWQGYVCVLAFVAALCLVLRYA